MSLFARVPLASGFLTGTLTADTEFAWNDKRGVIPRDEYLATLEQAEQMRFLEDEPGVSSMAEGRAQVCAGARGGGLGGGGDDASV